ncbi:tRNA lysidine(34) synthetase TilS [Vulcanococcus sp.]|uniref:tRNA lysidine(34) synthetase TilS n=1 Tax=Vulcanococcus sp. TaxID=2856995 RepID=UPI0037DA2970
MAPRWSRHHLRLHRWLLQRPALLPDGASLLIAVSGGQDSMTLVGLLQDLQRLHHWRLQLWHGNHRLRANAGEQAGELANWAAQEGLPVQIEVWQEPEPAEAAARAWRYTALAAAANRCGASHVVTGHTASDRAETLLLQLARGSHRRGLASLRPQRPLTAELTLVRPLLLFTRAETCQIHRQLGLPLWLDASNDDPRYSRNRLRQEVLPVLEQLHPGASRRISGVAERLAQEQDSQQELVELAMKGLLASPPAPHLTLQRRALMALQPANQRHLLQHWLKRQGVSSLPAPQLELLLARLAHGRGPGSTDLRAGVRLQWDRQHLWLQQASAGSPQKAEPTESP